LRAPFPTAKHEIMSNDPVQRYFVNVNLLQYEANNEWDMLTPNGFIRMSRDEMFRICKKRIKFSEMIDLIKSVWDIIQVLSGIHLDIIPKNSGIRLKRKPLRLQRGW
jgi:hypothetical protein